MEWIGFDKETRERWEVTDSNQIQLFARAAFVAIARWILSGADCPDGDATDGYSEYELANFN